MSFEPHCGEEREYPIRSFPSAHVFTISQEFEKYYVLLLTAYYFEPLFVNVCILQTHLEGPSKLV